MGGDVVKGTVRDIRTGRAIARTDSLTVTFLDHIATLHALGDPFYVVFGRCAHLDMRWCVEQIRSMGVRAIYDKQMPTDKMWVFEGDPEELGFKEAS